MRNLAKAVVITEYHVVSQDNRLEWENYTTQHDAWVQEALDVQKHDRNYHGQHYDDYFALGVIHDNMGQPRDYNATEALFPKWQNYPVVPVWPPYNWDGMVYPQLEAALPDLRSKRAVISDVVNFPGPYAQHNNDWMSKFIGEDEDASEPFSDFFYPILDCAAEGVSLEDGGDSEDDCALEGVVGVVFFWRDLLRDILAPGTKGMVGVIESVGCNQTFSYQINGPDTEYLGPSDMHDTAFSHFRQQSALNDLESHSTRDRLYTGVPIGDGTCRYQMSLYPSKEFQEDHLTSNPIVFTLAVLFVFVFTSALFLLYDFATRLRHTVVLKSAVDSTATVSVLEGIVNETTCSNKQLEEDNRRVTLASARQLQHFAMISHEIRTPLNAIIGMASLMQQGELDSLQRESMATIIASGELLLRVVNDVLSYSKLESGNVEVEIKEQRLQETMNAVVRSIEASARSKGIKIKTVYAATIGEVIQTDGRRLQQILYNLLGNAIKFSPDEGCIEIRVVHVYTTERPEPLFRFSVKDYGKGIEKENFDKIFRPFQQATNDTERIYGGTGLGLAITAKLVEALGGSISIDSELGKWTEFYFDLPLHAVADVEKLSSPLRNSTICLVGDTTDQEVTAAASIFQHFGVQSRSFGNMPQLESDKDTFSSLSLGGDHTFVFLVQEDYYDNAIYQRLAGQHRALLLTIGPKFLVKDASGHYRSINNVLPSELVRDIGDHVQTNAGTMKKKPSFASLAWEEESYQNYKVLIAEDNAVNQKVLLRMLKKLKIENVVVVDNGKKAVEREKAENFDVVLMDMQMPVMDGVDACQLIMERQRALGVPPVQATKVIFVTAHALDHFKEKCQRAGGAGFLSKPFRLNDVEDCFKRVQAMIQDGGSQHWYEHAS